MMYYFLFQEPIFEANFDDALLDAMPPSVSPPAPLLQDALFDEPPAMLLASPKDKNKKDRRSGSQVIV